MNNNWVVINTLKYDETKARTPAVQLSHKESTKPCRINVATDISVTTGFWDRGKEKFFPSVHFQIKYIEGLASLLIMTEEILKSMLMASAQTTGNKDAVQSKPPRDPNLKASIGDMMKAKK